MGVREALKCYGIEGKGSASGWLLYTSITSKMLAR